MTFTSVFKCILTSAYTYKTTKDFLKLSVTAKQMLVLSEMIVVTYNMFHCIILGYKIILFKLKIQN